MNEQRSRRSLWLYFLVGAVLAFVFHSYREPTAEEIAARTLSSGVLLYLGFGLVDGLLLWFMSKYSPDILCGMLCVIYGNILGTLTVDLMHGYAVSAVLVGSLAEAVLASAIYNLIVKRMRRDGTS